jgi:hypothetical protein
VKTTRVVSLLLMGAALSACSHAAVTPTGPGRTRSGTPDLPTASPDVLGLIWEECPMTGSEYPSFNVAEGCFRHPWPDYGDISSTYGSRLADGPWKLVIGTDTYTTTPRADVLLSVVRETLYRNGQPIRSLTGTMTAFDPGVALRNLDGKVAWEFAGGDVATVIYDGQDLREEFGVAEARRPHTIRGKLIFVARQDGKAFVVYDGRRIGPDFDEIFTAYCCMIGLSSVRFGRDAYAFVARRDGTPYVVLITGAPRE